MRPLASVTRLCDARLVRHATRSEPRGNRCSGGERGRGCVGFRKRVEHQRFDTRTLSAVANALTGFAREKTRILRVKVLTQAFVIRCNHDGLTAAALRSLLQTMSSAEYLQGPASLATRMGWIGPERRVHPRVEFAAEAKLFVEDRPLGRYAVKDISVGGALVVGDLAPNVGERVGVAITASQLGTVRLEARVIRVQSQGRRNGIAIEFLKPPSHIARMIEEVVLSELERVHRASSPTDLGGASR